ncbi:MAG: nucleotide exchange factor GrpE [Bacteroidales bacterium]|nr:nucleotide exchange factor GrpE [Bacteroidales bacterium]
MEEEKIVDETIAPETHSEASEPQQPEAPQTEETPQADDTHKEESRRERRKREKEERQQAATEQMQQMGEKLNEINDKYLRLYSEYENYRKRTNTEKADLILNGGKDVLKAILPVIDDMERALQHTTDEAAKEGLTLIYNKMMNTLAQKGLKPMEAKGEKFDENLHEAVTQFPAPSDDLKGKVVDVVEKGYYLNDKVLRYAKVVVGI